jgi:alkylation response protein AidB-like acyl-CoA dehydrogenase
MFSQPIHSRDDAATKLGHPTVYLEAATPAGRTFVKLAAEHARMASEHAAQHDRDGTFPIEVFDAMRTSGFIAATVPERFGGLGVDSVHDLTVGLCEIGRADGSTAIAANMHLVFPLVAQWLQNILTWRHLPQEAKRIDGVLAYLAGGAIVMGNVTEPGTDLTHPLAEATETDGGWRLTGHKIFGTLAPVADWFVVSCRLPRPNSTFASAYALVPRGAAGQEIQENWDALGMRASGSSDVLYRRCFVPDDRMFTLNEDWGADSEISQVTATVGNIGLLGAFLGIAEAARDHAVAALTKRVGNSAPSLPDVHSYSNHHIVAEMEIALTSMRSVVVRTTQLVDRLICNAAPEIFTPAGLRTMVQQFQCAKLLVNRGAIDVVDSALTLTGGASYGARHPLARLYRDVRAGPFMQPYSPKEAYDRIGRLALDPTPRQRFDAW